MPDHIIRRGTKRYCQSSDGEKKVEFSNGGNRFEKYVGLDDRSVEFKIHLYAMSEAVFAVHPSFREPYFVLGGGSITLELFRKAGIEIGGGVLYPSGYDFFLRGGIVVDVSRGRDWYRRGWVTQFVLAGGYHSLFTSGIGDNGADKHAHCINAIFGIEFTHWYSKKIGINLRPELGLNVPLNPDEIHSVFTQTLHNGHCHLT